MDLSNQFASIGAAVYEARERAKVVEIIAEDGMPYCQKCGEPLLLPLSFHGPLAETLGATRYVPRNCECLRVMFAQEEERKAQIKRAEELVKIRETALREPKYREMTFTHDDGLQPKIRRMCEDYVTQYKGAIENNLGLAFIGANGVGKTFWAACLANALIDAGASVLMVTLKRLIDEMTAQYGEDREYILHKVRTVDFLILDDYGAERGTDFSLEQAFEIIDTRQNSKKPLIITANLTEETLRNPPSMAYKRSYSRIIEMCPAIIKVEGERRENIAAEKRKMLAELLKGART